MDRPILFKDEMVRAIIEGRKTQTRRVMKVQPPSEKHQLLNVMSSTDRSVEGKSHWAVLNADKTSVLESDKKYFSHPYGQVGDRLWVREAFQGPLLPYEQAQEFFNHREKFESPRYCEYRADGGPAPVFVNADDEERHGWRPSIHMPRWASRITLEITGVRVERLKDISECEAKAEGAEPFDVRGFSPGSIDLLDAPEKNADQPFRNGFSLLWESINGPGSWDENPWVWVIEFRRVD